MPTQQLTLTQQNDVGLQSKIKVVLKWKQFDIAREENEEMRLMLWGEWVGGGMRRGSQTRKKRCIVDVLCWNGTKALTQCETDCFSLKRVDPTLNIRGEMRAQSCLRNNWISRNCYLNTETHNTHKKHFGWKVKHLLHRFKQSLAVVLKGHDEFELSASRLHCCWGKTDNTAINNTLT